MLQAEVHARALRISLGREDNIVERAGSITVPAPSNVETVHEIILKPDLLLIICFLLPALSNSGNCS
jgi:hypothetical protein